MLYGLTWELKLETCFVVEQKYLVTAGPGEGPGDESQKPGLDPSPRFPELPWETPGAAGNPAHC